MYSKQQFIKKYVQPYIDKVGDEYVRKYEV